MGNTVRLEHAPVKHVHAHAPQVQTVGGRIERFNQPATTSQANPFWSPNRLPHDTLKRVPARCL